MNLFKRLYSTIEKHHFLFIILAYFLVNLLFMHPFWRELFFDKSKIGARYGEVFVAEWAIDKVYQNITSGRNPFARSESVLYPFGTDFTTTDSGNGFFFVFLRPFLSAHQSLSVMVAIGLFFANMGMYLFLRKLRISKSVSFLIGLAFGYMTFLMPRMGHLNYMSIYVFPWFYFCGLSFFRESRKGIKILLSVGIALFFVLSLYLNLYYFVMILLSTSILIIYALLFSRSCFLLKIKGSLKYIFLIFLLIGLFLSPWLKALYETFLFEELPQTVGWGGAIEGSSDLFGYFIPSIYSYFLKGVTVFIGSHFQFAYGIFENFTYPGVFIIFTYMTLFILKLKNKVPNKLYLSIRPYLCVSIIFWILTLGPFLHIFGKWSWLNKVSIPLPYIFFHFLPFMANIRIPGRLIVAFIFFSYIIGGYLFDYVLKTKTHIFRTILFVAFLTIFIIDHYFEINIPPPHFIPNSLYNTIAKDQSNITVMEVPSVVRDGFTYFGNNDALGFIEGQQIHKKQVLAGYLGRIPYFKTNYYQRNPFLGYMGRLMDNNLAHNGGIEKNDFSNWKEIDLKRSIDSINFLDLKYLLIDDNKVFSGSISATFADLGFKKIQQENYFSLWKREPDKKEYLTVDIGGPDDDMFLGVGWNSRDSGFRYAWKKSSVLFKIYKPRKLNLVFNAMSFHEDQSVDIYINKKKVGRIYINQSLKDYTLPINEIFSPGINIINFRFTKTFRPANVIPGSKNRNQYSVKFTKISLMEN